MVTEARLERLESGLAPVTPGWFTVNAADAAWVNSDFFGGVCNFESDDFVLQGRPDLTEYVSRTPGSRSASCRRDNHRLSTTQSRSRRTS